MRFYCSVLLFALAGPVLADAYKCKSPTGQTIFTERPCENGHVQASSARSYANDADNAIRAKADVQRQKDWLSRRDAERYSVAPVAVTSSPPPYNRDAIYACLMKITATTGLSPYEEASRKVPCYPSGVGLIEECKSSVVATMRLSTRDEALIKSRCR